MGHEGGSPRSNFGLVSVILVGSFSAFFQVLTRRFLSGCSFLPPPVALQRFIHTRPVSTLSSVCKQSQGFQLQVPTGLALCARYAGGRARVWLCDPRIPHCYQVPTGPKLLANHECGYRVQAIRLPCVLSKTLQKWSMMIKRWTL